jgi:hypothetical protein
MFEHQRLVIAGGRHICRHGHPQAVRDRFHVAAHRSGACLRRGQGRSDSARPMARSRSPSGRSSPSGRASRACRCRDRRQAPAGPQGPPRRHWHREFHRQHDIVAIADGSHAVGEEHLRARPVDRHAFDTLRRAQAENRWNAALPGRAPIGLPSRRQRDAGCPPCGDRFPSASLRSTRPVRPRPRFALRTGRAWASAQECGREKGGEAGSGQTSKHGTQVVSVP